MKITNNKFTNKDTAEDTQSDSGAEGGYPFYEEPPKRSFFNRISYLTYSSRLRIFFMCSPMNELVITLKWLAILKILLLL